jgi:hypothetical protein
MLHYSRRLPHEGKTSKASSGGGPKPGPLGPDSLLCAPVSHIELARIIHESAAPTVDMSVLPGVLRCRPLRRTARYASEPTPCGCQVARPSSRPHDTDS